MCWLPQQFFLDLPSMSTMSILVTNGSSISSKYPLDFSTFSLGAYFLLGNGPMILDNTILVLDLIHPVNSIISSSL